MPSTTIDSRPHTHTGKERAVTIKIGNRCVHIEHDDHDEVGASDTSWYNVEDGNDGNVVIAHHFTSSYDCIATRYTSISPDAAVLFATQLLAASVTLKGVDVPTDPDPALGHGVAGSGWDISELQDDDDLDPLALHLLRQGELMRR